MALPNNGVFGSVLTYSGISLGLVGTNFIERSPIYSEDGTEYLWTHWVFDVTCVYNQGISNNTPTATDNAVRGALMTPRCALTYTVNGEQLISSPNGLPTDVNNGPRPISCKISKNIGGTTFLVQYKVETWVTECQVGRPDTVISNRWKTIDTVDEQLRTTKRYIGRAVLRADNLAGLQFSADHYRSFLFPPVPLGFKRVQMNVQLSEANNMLFYDVVDQEQFVTIGNQHQSNGVMKWEAFYMTGTLEDEGGAAVPMCKAGIEISVWGERDTDNLTLALWCIRLAYQKLQLDAPGANMPVLRRVHFMTALHDRHVKLQCEVMKAPVNAANNVSILDLLQLKDDKIKVFTNDGVSPQPYVEGTRGSHQWDMLAQSIRGYCQTCVDQNNQNSYLQPVEWGDDGSDGNYDNTYPKVNVSLGDYLPYYENNQYSDNIYNEYRVDVHYETDMGVIQAPVSAGTYYGSSLGGQTTSYPSQAVSSSFMQAYTPMTKKVVTWTAQRFGEVPVIPDPVPQDTNLVLLHQKYQLTAPEVMADTETEIYHASGTYYYGLKNPQKPGDVLKTGSLPWTTLTFGQGEYDEWADGILDNTGQNPVSQLGGTN